VAEDEEKQDGGGERYGKGSEEPTRQRDRNNDGAQPFTSLRFHDFLSEQ
jgi:hypothetical protein